MLQPDLIVYGGAFDPPHQGHAEALLEVHRAFPEAMIHIIPGVRPAGASGSHKTPASSFSDRIHLCRLAFADVLNTQHAIIDTIEFQLPEPNYTVNTLEQIQNRYSPKQLSLLIGEDQLKSFDSWHQPKQILSLANLIVIARQFVQTETEQRADLKTLAERSLDKLNIAITWQSPEWGHLSPDSKRIFKLQKSISPAESRIIRAQLGEGSPPPSGWLAPEVSKYIEEHNLYRRQ